MLLYNDINKTEPTTIGKTLTSSRDFPVSDCASSKCLSVFLSLLVWSIVQIMLPKLC